jgi:hypothetical protein
MCLPKSICPASSAISAAGRFGTSTTSSNPSLRFASGAIGRPPPANCPFVMTTF